MRIGLFGLVDHYWCRALPESIRGVEGVSFVGVAALGTADTYLTEIAGFTRAEFGQRFSVPVYDAPEDLVREQRPDAVFIATEHSRAVELVEVAARHRLHAYIAKPMASKPADLDRIVAAVRGAGIIATSGNTARFHPMLRAAWERVRAGDIGRLMSVHVMHQHGSIDDFRPAHWYRREGEGGPELSLAWYVVDLLTWFAQAPVKRVFAEYGNFASPDSPFMDEGKILLRFADGVMATADVHFAARWRSPTWGLEVVGDAGMIRVCEPYADGMRFAPEGVASFVHPVVPGLLNAEVREWVRACRAQRDPEVTIEVPAVSEYTWYLRSEQEAQKAWELITADCLRAQRASGLFVTMSHFYAMTGPFKRGLELYERFFDYVESRWKVQYRTVAEVAEGPLGPWPL